MPKFEGFCDQPFKGMEILGGGRCFVCCPAWVRLCVGNIRQRSLVEVFNDNKAYAVRQSILDGDYKYCRAEYCSILGAGTLHKDTTGFEELIQQHHDRTLQPARLTLMYDRSCMLVCPACRPHRIMVSGGPQMRKNRRIHQATMDYVYNAEHELLLTAMGSGDPFASRLMRNMLLHDWSDKPNIRFCLHTNGQMLTEQMWKILGETAEHVDEVLVSVDAGDAEQYAKTRGGSWPLLLENLEGIGERRRTGKLRVFRVNLIVQRANFRGMVDYVKLAKRVHVDTAAFFKLRDHNTWTPQGYQNRCIWRPKHPHYQEFLKIMADPIFDDPIVQLGAMLPYRTRALEKYGETDAK
jgi:pyruvate-formate lyase-activating enzyme